MEFIGRILSESDPPGISRQRWIDLIHEHPNLAPVPPREGINPFTKEPMTFRPPRDFARVVVDGTDVGTMSWAANEENLIVVIGERQVVGPLAHNIAKRLGGCFDETSAGEIRDLT